MTTRSGPAVERALLTGATGFVGSHLAQALTDRGVEVHAITRRGRGSKGIPDFVAPHEDPGTASALSKIVADIGPSTCFHLATHFVAEHDVDDIEGLAESNLAFAMRVAEAVAGSECDTFVNAATFWQHVGGAPYDPKCLYAATKQAFEDILRWYSRAGSFRVGTLVLSDIYGPGDPRPKLLNALREAASTDTPLPMSSGDALVDFVHIDDVVDALAATADAVRQGDAADMQYAVTSGTPRTVREVTALASEVWGRPIPVTWGARPERANEMLTPWETAPPPPGWTAHVPLEEGLVALAP